MEEKRVGGAHRVGGRAFNGEGNEVHAPQQHQSQTPLLLPLWPLVLGPDLAELLAVCQHQVHVPVKGQEGADEHAAIQESDPHAMLHVLAQLALARLQG